MTREKAINLLKKYYDNGLFFEDLSRRVAFQTESQNPNQVSSLYDYFYQEIIPYLKGMGFKCKIYDNPDKEFKGPFLIANRYEGPTLPTVLVYGHGDVVRGQKNEWREGFCPWTVVKEKGRLYGRGTADNKGQHTINFAAIKYILEARKNKLGFNIKIFMETGEERGSPGLREFCIQNKYLLTADVLISSDGPRLHKDRPTIFMGSRGVFNFNMKVELRKGSHHSGNWGGLLANPGVILANAISSMISSSGEIKINGLKPKTIPKNIKKVLSKIKINDDYDDPIIDINWGESGLTLEEKLFAWNTLEILSFETGNPKNPMHAIPPNAIANCHIRYVVPSDPKTFLKLIRNHLDKNGFEIVDIEQTRGFMYATRLSPNHPWAKWVIKSLKKTTKMEIDVLPNLGGTLPNDAFADILNMPTIWIPHSYTSCLQHAPNEHILESVTQSSLKMMAGIFWDLGEAGTPK